MNSFVRAFSEFKWTYFIIALLIIVIVVLYFNRNKCPMPGNVVSNEGYQPFVEKEYDYTKEVKTPENNPVDNVKGEIILYYATWCGYSRMFLPEWDKFEKYAKDNFPYLKVTKFRCEGGDERTCVDKGIEGYPTVILYPKNDTEIVFEKDRTSDELIKFVNEHIN